MAFAPPVYNVEPTFKPVGSNLQASPQEMGQNFDRFNQDEKARFFQQHLQKGLDGMMEVMQQLPPEIQAQVGDPSAMAGSDEHRVAWYMGVNQAINRSNMASAAQAGNTADVERLGLNDPKATQKDFQTFSENQALDTFVQDFNPTKQTTKMVYQSGGLKNALAGQESGGNYEAIGPVYTKQDGSQSDPNKGEVALGKYQILPSTWFKTIGLDPLSKEDRQKFLSTPELQDKAFENVLNDSLQTYGGDVDKVIASYYGGPNGAKVVNTPDGDKPQSAGMPSVNEYVKQVKERLGKNPESKSEIVTQDENKTQADVAMEILKKDPRLIDKIEPILKYLGKSSNDIEMLKLAMREKENADKNNRFNRATAVRVQQFADKSSQDLYEKLTKQEVPVIGQTVKDLDLAMSKVGGLAAANAVPGTDAWNKSVLPFMQSEEGSNLGGLLQRLYSLELKRISGVAVSDAEFDRYKKAFESGKTFSPEKQMYALRAFVRAYRTQLKLAKAAYGEDIWTRVAGPAGLDLKDIPDVPDAVGNPPGTTSEGGKGQEKRAEALRKKYSY